MGKQALDAKRGVIFSIEPERLTLVYDKNHPLYDPRVEEAPDENMISNIAMYGVLEPVLVRKNGSDVEVVSGRRRTKAALEANRRLKSQGKQPLLVPALVKGGSDADLFGILISENEIRRDDNMITRGIKARKLLNMGYSKQQISVVFGVTPQTIDNWLMAEELPEEIKKDVESGVVSASAALQLSEYSKEEQLKRYKDVKNQGQKPTVSVLKTIASSENKEVEPKMKTRKQIKERYESYMKDTEYSRGYKKALEWVLSFERKTE